MSRLSKVIYSGVRVKGWVIVFVLSILLLSFGLSGFIGRIIPSVDFLKFISAKRLSAHTREVVNQLTGLVTIDIIAFVIGLWGMIFAVRRGLYSVLTILNPGKEDNLINKIYEEVKLKRGPNIVVLGGGEGIIPVLQGLKAYSSNISAGVLPFECDLRNSIVALSNTSPLLDKLFHYEFEKAELKGKNFGELFIDSLSQVAGNVNGMVEEAKGVLSLTGKIIPVTSDKIEIGAVFSDNKRIVGESKIKRKNERIKSIFIKPQGFRVNQELLDKIAAADAVVIAPGNIHTVVMPFFYISEIKAVLKKTKCAVIFVCNLMTGKNETTKNSVSSYLDKLSNFAGENMIDYCIVNTGVIHGKVLHRYYKNNSLQVIFDEEESGKYGFKIIKRNLASVSENGYIRHEPVILAKTIIKLISI
jgi:uncharacterized cofD-like protein